MEAARARERDEQILREQRERQDRMAQEEREHQKAMFQLIGNMLNSLSGNRQAHHSKPHTEPAAIHSLPPPPSNTQQATSSVQQAHPEKAYYNQYSLQEGSFMNLLQD